MRVRLLAVGSALLLGVPAAVAAAQPAALTGASVNGGGVTAAVTGAQASLTNGVISRTWSIGDRRAVQTTKVTGPEGRQWARPGPDFRIDVDGAPTSANHGWALISVTATAPPALPGRPVSGQGGALLFRYALAASATEPAGVELDRLVVLHPGAAVVETTSTLVNHSAAPVRITSYTLDEITAPSSTMPAEVHAYSGGSDWRDDYRRVSHPTGDFDSEGEVVRFGYDAGFFLVSQRRGGLMSRAGRGANGRSWVGVDWARDLFDFGPLRTDPPHYNQLRNPAYPVPVRARVVPPLGDLALGTSFLGVYDGGAAEAAAAFTSNFAGAAEPAYKHSVSLNTFHPWSHGPDLSDPNLRTQVDIAKSLGVETFMIDDQWQGGPGGESGDWKFDAERFPDADGNGTPDFVEYLHAQGLQLGLWMSPVEFHGTSETYAAHPQWACAPVGDATAQIEDDAGLGVWNANNPKFQDYIVGVVDRLVRDYDVREFKFDFMAWVDCLPHDYADYEDAFVSIVRQMQQRHPNVTFELDETNDQRLWPFQSAALGPSWFDNGHLHGSGRVEKLLHDVWTAAPWVPTSSLGVGTFDGTLEGPYAGVEGVDFLFPLAMLTHITFWTDLTELSPEQRDETSWWVQWYAAHRDELGPAVYELTSADPIDGTAWAAWQPWDGDEGYVFAFRQSGGAATQGLRLHGVDPAASYAVTNVHTGADLGVFTGVELAAGLPVSLPVHAAAVLAVDRLP